MVVPTTYMPGIPVHMPNIPCTLRTAGSLIRCSDSIPTKKKTTHVMLVLLYSSVARTCKEVMLPTPLVVTFGLFTEDEPLTSQEKWPIVALQLKVAVVPRVALTDVGVPTSPG